MTTTGDGRTLPWRILRRTVKPYALAVSLSTFVVSYVLPPDQHWPFLDRFSRPNKSKENTDEN